MGTLIDYRPEEGLERGGLVPPDEELPVGVVEETSDIRPAEGESCDGEGEAHGDGGLQVAPLRHVVASPDGRDPLRPGERRPGGRGNIGMFS